MRPRYSKTLVTQQKLSRFSQSIILVSCRRWGHLQTRPTFYIGTLPLTFLETHSRPSRLPLGVPFNARWGGKRVIFLITKFKKLDYLLQFTNCFLSVRESQNWTKHLLFCRKIESMAARPNHGHEQRYKEAWHQKKSLASFADFFSDPIFSFLTHFGALSHAFFKWSTFIFHVLGVQLIK